MAYIKVSEFESLVKAKKLSGIILLAGDENFLIDNCLKKIEEVIKTDELSREVFYCVQTPAAQILDALQTPAFLGDRRLVIVKDLCDIDKRDAQIFIDYLENPADINCLVLIYRQSLKNKKEIAARKELLRVLSSSKYCMSVSCAKLYEREIEAFIRARFKSAGKEIDYDAPSKLIDENGLDLANIINEIDKLLLFCKDKKSVNVGDIIYAGGQTKEANIYALTEFIYAKNKKESFLVLERLLSQGQEPTVILAAITSAIKKLLIGKSLQAQKGESFKQLLPANMLWKLEKPFAQALSQRTLKSLQDDLNYILET
ncbi:MAG: DNA polymerase III subunit delta, partial [Elusimicrobiota bacterium]|nr:DNA polymerase III subunit delta [Elusimicrobiota bacterium]